MLVVDHERPLRSLPALFSAEARAALASTRQGERPTLLRPARVRVREIPERARRRRDRERRAEDKRAERRERRRPVRRRHAEEPVPESAAAELAGPEQWPPAERAGPLWLGTSTPYAEADTDWDEPEPTERAWAPAPHRAEPGPFTEGWVAPPPADRAAAPPADRAAAPPADRAAAPPAAPPHAHTVPSDPAPAGARPLEERVLLPARKAR